MIQPYLYITRLSLTSLITEIVIFRSLSDEECESKANARKGLIFSIMLHSQKPRQFKFIQMVMGVELWRQGASHKLYELLNFLGISQGVDAARSHTDKLSDGYDQQLQNWKLEKEVSHQTLPCIIMELCHIINFIYHTIL